MSGNDEIVREGAYDLWEQAGRPEGRSPEFWFAARCELEGEGATAMPGQHIVEQGVVDEGPEELAFLLVARSAAD